jgi:hypothetical protein
LFHSNVLHIELFQLGKVGDTVSVPSISQIHNAKPYATIELSDFKESTMFQFNNVPAHYQYAVLAYLKPDTQWNTMSKYVNVAGWYRTDKCGWLAVIPVGSEDITHLIIEMRGVRAFSTSNIKSNVNGYIDFKKGLPVLNLWGSTKERGYAHGYLIAEQILDFFSYFILEGTAGSCDLYDKKWIPMIQESISSSANTPYYFEAEFMEEASALINGMRDSGVNMYLTELGRNFSVLDILAINSYIELEFLKRDSTNYQSKGACTQFAFWRNQTKNTPGVHGNTIAARNMDGELDFRRVTVTNFLIFAIHPSSGKRFVSMMWPGFIGTLSGVNEDGQYIMMNYGVSSSLQPEWNQVVPVNWIVKQLLQYPKVNIDEANAKTTLDQVKLYNAKTGGPCITGCILFFAKPYKNNSKESPVYVYEGDYKDGFMRIPGEADPIYIEDLILASNHYHKYGVDPSKGPHYNFGRLQYFDTLVRYQSGSNKVTSYNDVATISGRISQLHARDALQSVAHGTTEHSIIYRNAGNTIFIEIAIAERYELKKGWDAPYLEWASFAFHEFFNQKHSVLGDGLILY